MEGLVCKQVSIPGLDRNIRLHHTIRLCDIMLRDQKDRKNRKVLKFNHYFVINYCVCSIRPEIQYYTTKSGATIFINYIGLFMLVIVKLINNCVYRPIVIHVQ